MEKFRLLFYEAFFRKNPVTRISVPAGTVEPLAISLVPDAAIYPSHINSPLIFMIVVSCLYSVAAGNVKNSVLLAIALVTRQDTA